MLAFIKHLFCHHEWDRSRRRPGAHVCRKCGHRIPAKP